MRIYCSDALFLAEEGGGAGEIEESRHSSKLNAFFKVELNFVQNPPGGRHY